MPPACTQVTAVTPAQLAERRRRQSLSSCTATLRYSRLSAIAVRCLEYDGLRRCWEERAHAGCGGCRCASTASAATAVAAWPRHRKALRCGGKTSGDGHAAPHSATCKARVRRLRRRHQRRLEGG